MKLTTGLIVVIISMILFYLRIAFLRGRKKRYEREFALKRRRVNGRSKGAALPKAPAGTPPYSINSWFLVAVALIIVIFGFLLYNKMYFLNLQLISDQNFLDTFTPLWYIPVSVGILLFAFCFKIDKPLEDE